MISTKISRAGQIFIWALYKLQLMRSTIIFSSKGNTVKNKSDIRFSISFQYLVYYILHTWNINDNRVFKVTLLSIFELYGILFNVKEKWFVLEIKNPCRPVILANIWVKPTTNCYRNEKCIFEIYNPLCISEKSPQMLHDGKYNFFWYESGTLNPQKMCVTIGK